MAAKRIVDAFSTLGQKLATNESDLAIEIAKRGLKNISDNPASYAKKAYKAVASDGFDKEVASKLAKATFADGKLSADGVGQDVLDRVTDRIVADKQTFSSIAGTTKGTKLSEENLSFIAQNSNPLSYAKSYYSEEGKKAARIGTTAGGMVGARLLSGGNLTTNSSGERDIVGVPFL